MKITIDMPIVPGFKYTGEFRPAREGEYYYCAHAKDVAQLVDAVPFDHDPTPIMEEYDIKKVFKAYAEAIAEAVGYLDDNDHNSIAAGSQLHSTLRAALDE